MAGSLLAAGTGSITFLSQQSKTKSKKRRRSEAVATDAAPGAAPAAALPAARVDPSSEGLSAKARQKAAKQLRRAAASGSGRAEGHEQEEPKAEAQAATDPDSSTKSLPSQEIAGKLL